MNAAPRPDIVQYLALHLNDFPIEALRQQLLTEGVTEAEFDASLDVALRSRAKTIRLPPRPAGAGAARFLIAGGVTVVLMVVVFALSRRTDTSVPGDRPAATTATSTAGPTGESGYVSPRGWVVRLPKGYIGTSTFKDEAKTDEIVHFSPAGADSTDFLNEGLFAQLGIVRLEVAPSPFPAGAAGLTQLTAAVSRKTTAHGDKFSMKNIQIATLSGVQVNITSPFPRVEAYLLGQHEVYFFYGGAENDLWRDIVLSLRDTSNDN